MTGELPYEGAGADYVIIRRIFESPRPQVNGESRLSDCLQLWELMIRCWAAEPSERPTSSMCKTVVTYLPHCPPAPETADRHTRSAALLENLGELESWRGDHKAAFARLDQALYIYEEQGNDRGIASALRKQAVVSSRVSDYPRLAKVAAAALEKFRCLDDANGIADALFWTGVYFMAVKEEEKALSYLQHSLEIFRTERNPVGIGQCLERLGELHRRKSQTLEALSTLEEAVDVASRYGDKLGEARALIILGVTRWGFDDLGDVMATFSKVHEIAQSIGWEHGVATALCRMGGVAMEQGNLAEAEEFLRQSVFVARRSDAGWRLAQALHYLARCLQAQNHLEEATSIMEESWSLNMVINENVTDPSFAESCALLAGAKSDSGDSEGALVWFDRAITVFRNGHKTFSLSKYLAEKGIVLMNIGRCDEGGLHFEASMILDRELGEYGAVGWNRAKLSSIPKTAIKWEIRRQSRLALAKVQSLRTTSLLCDVKKLQLRVPQLTTPKLKSPVRPVDRRES
ncbi:hypothetical protein M407DRAFT_35010 [Tulasnella calospora MUT 4182]|uniref:Tetratricopeptide repeat protein 29 n=1 Tax=Tulasnella calospora MUT 4182 TaxID=1051891 RepID=A0A0C3L110_9AGAM|nr:hypothetical protein M407DRAFT_35010 [Tulasnella calospora MUT 4182]